MTSNSARGSSRRRKRTSSVRPRRSREDIMGHQSRRRAAVLRPGTGVRSGDGLPRWAQGRAQGREWRQRHGADRAGHRDLDGALGLATTLVVADSAGDLDEPDAHCRCPAASRRRGACRPPLPARGRRRRRPRRAYRSRPSSSSRRCDRTARSPPRRARPPRDARWRCGPGVRALGAERGRHGEQRAEGRASPWRRGRRARRRAPRRPRRARAPGPPSPRGAGEQHAVSLGTGGRRRQAASPALRAAPRGEHRGLQRVQLGPATSPTSPMPRARRPTRLPANRRRPAGGHREARSSPTPGSTTCVSRP